MEKETVEEQWIYVDLQKLCKQLTEEAWMSECDQQNTDDLYHIHLVELPYMIPVMQVKKTVKNYWQAIYDRAYRKYKEIIMSCAKDNLYGNNEAHTQT